MKHRSSRTNKARSAFRIDSLLASKLKNRNDSERLGDYMTLMFLGFFDKSISEDEVVEVETFLSQISHKKRKDSSKAMQERVRTIYTYYTHDWRLKLTVCISDGHFDSEN